MPEPKVISKEHFDRGYYKRCKAFPAIPVILSVLFFQILNGIDNITAEIESDLEEYKSLDVSNDTRKDGTIAVADSGTDEISFLKDYGRFSFFEVIEHDQHQINQTSRGSFTFATNLENGTSSATNRQKNLFRTDLFHVSSIDSSPTKKISILGLYELMSKRKRSKTAGINVRERDVYEERAEGKSELWAAILAVDHVNKRKLFGGYQLELYSNDTKCDPGVAVDTFFHAIFSRGTRVPILLGTACSEATASLANIVPYWNIVQISFGATSPVLSDRKEFPLFYRVVASDASHNAARLAFVKYFGWHTVTVISQNEKEYTLAVNDLIKKLEQDNITCKGTVTFGENDFQDQLQLLKDLDTRIIFGSFSKEVAPKIFCKVYELGMYGADYAWILQGSPSDANWKWWKDQSDCSDKWLTSAVQNVIFVSNHYDSEKPAHPFSGFTNEDLERELLQRSLPVGRYSRESYDAVWTAAIALNETLREWKQIQPETDITNLNRHSYNMSKSIFRQISLMNFTGVSGPISFEGADRIGPSAFYQLQGDDLVTVALYFPSHQELNFSCFHCKSIIWSGGQVPVSQRYLKQRIETISTEAFIAVACCTSLAIVLAIVFLIFNLYFRKLKYIKLSSPRLNNIAIVGCIAVYIGVFLLGFDHATSPDVGYFPIICTAKVYFFAAGFSLAFGSIFAKTYRIHKIFIRSQGGFVKKKFLQDTQLILLVCVLLLIDGLILTLWVAVDPMERQLRNLTIEYSTEDRSVIYQPQIEICSCEHLNSWLSSLYMYKGLQLVMGVYMAWETRHVKIPVLNDSQYIGMSVYSVVITSCIVVVLANLISERPTVAYVSISAMILTSTTATLCLLFLPKLWVICSRSDNCDPVMQSMGLKLESNTRRFVMDDMKEKLFRLEVQNRVFKREALALKAEIVRLERQLGVSSASLDDSPASVRSHSDIDKNQEAPSAMSLPSSLKESDLQIKTDIDNQKHHSRNAKAPRSSWPSEMHGILKLNRSLSFQLDHKSEDLPLKTEAKLTFRVMEGIRNLISTKKCESKLKDIPKKTEIISFIDKTSEDVSSQAKRKFSLTRCLHPKNKYSNKNIVIDVNLTSEEDLREFNVCKEPRHQEKRTRFQHQISHPVLSARGKFKGSPRFPHKIVPTTSLTMLNSNDIVTKSKSIESHLSAMGEKSKSLEDTRNVILHNAEVLASPDNSPI